MKGESLLKEKIRFSIAAVMRCSANDRKDIISKSYCGVCGNEMRKWYSQSEYEWKSMCIDVNCKDKGLVYRAIKNVSCFKIICSAKM